MVESTSKAPAPVVKPAPAPAPKPAPITIYINGVKQVYEQPPIKENCTTLVPVRGVFEALGATVNWDQQRQLVTAQHNKTVIHLKIGSKSPTVNGKAVSISVPAQIKNGRTMVPLRFVSEALGATVHYDHLTRTITIN